MTKAYDFCARVQNGFRGRLASIMVRETKLNLAMAKVLYHEGFISSLSRGNHLGPDAAFTPTTPDNIATRHLWLFLKYKDNEPVLTTMSAVSKPSRKLWFTVHELQNLVSGKRAKFIAPLQPGEIGIISTSQGIMEIHKALEQNHGGEFLARAK